MIRANIRKVCFGLHNAVISHSFEQYAIKRPSDHGSIFLQSVNIMVNCRTDVMHQHNGGERGISQNSVIEDTLRSLSAVRNTARTLPFVTEHYLEWTELC